MDNVRQQMPEHLAEEAADTFPLQMLEEFTLVHSFRIFTSPVAP